LRLLYPNNPEKYQDLAKTYLEQNRYWLAPDGHPKNVLVNPEGTIALIDFGRSHYADQRYMLPNFLAHIVIYTLAGYIDKNSAAEYIQKAIKAYQELEPIDPPLFCQYLAMEVLHRAFGKWIQGVDKTEQKVKLVKFGLEVFDRPVVTIDSLISLLS